MNEIYQTPNISNESMRRPVDEALASEWVINVADNYLDRKFMIGSEEVTFDDAVMKREVDARGKRTGESHPEVTIIDKLGNKLKISATDFLEFSGRDADSIREELDDAKAHEQQKNLKTHPLKVRKFALYEPVAEINAHSKREEMLFAPVESDSETVDNYDDLLNKDIEIESSVEEASVRDRARTTVTEKTKDQAESRLQQTLANDQRLSDMVTRYAMANELSGYDSLTEALRTDAALRLEVGRYFLGKIDRISGQLPQRFQYNAKKSAPIDGYEGIPAMKSQEYTALLALAMLDGTFDDERAKSNPIETNPNGEVIRGQHRFAAQKILELV